MERSTHFTFNTAISGVEEETGRFNEDAHRELILPLRGRIMQIDGVCGLSIYRYGMNVKSVPEVIDRDTLETGVQDAIEWAAQQDGLFPLRGDKTPEAAMERPSPPDPTRDTVVVRFGSSVVTYMPGGKGGEQLDDESFRLAIQDLAMSLTDTDGVISYRLRLLGASLTFDTRITTRDVIIAHMRNVLRDRATYIKYFPYVKGSDELELEFS